MQITDDSFINGIDMLDNINIGGRFNKSYDLIPLLSAFRDGQLSFCSASLQQESRSQPIATYFYV